MFRVEFLRDDRIVGSATYTDLHPAILHIKDRNTFRSRYAATAAYVFDVDKQHIVYSYAETTCDADSVETDIGVSLALRHGLVTSEGANASRAKNPAERGGVNMLT
ncbi:hypothetical protein MPC4_150079 [Methylocella tundrae]|uniref:Uncharacterized protein n=1 Tax=Methylocella tundrae TaxID=227605 RepID=A0A8B6M2Q4_METTU|nr:hypothetical protein [Methylocella tundrae]VTZ49297.1 hypothetical protein MPC4_150079 [Methylocella tundrae]